MKKDVGNHLGKQVAKNSYYCHSCEKTIMCKRFKFKHHLYMHGKINARFTCEFCLKEFYLRDAYFRHLMAHKTKKREETNVKQAQKLHFCDVCGKSYIEKRNLIQHFRVHDNTFRPTRIRYSCKVCGIEFCENRVLLGHIRKTHFNLQVKESPHKKKLPNETWVEKVMQSDAYVEMTKLTDNVIVIKKCILTETEKKKIKDNRIVKTIDYESFYSDNKYHKAKDVCRYCKKTMLKKSLANHIRERHLKVRRYKCDTCNSKFNRRYQWTNHTCGRSRRKR
ncbi:unnamed protein product [Parnassius mnemosyne]|uniref:C2H2-type domain-containing protein n=1 Tax=Parnassius mnemosyne TaxID=213953 RepID=A0AAV1LDJ1_9NEOP